MILSEIAFVSQEKKKDETGWANYIFSNVLISNFRSQTMSNQFTPYKVFALLVLKTCIRKLRRNFYTVVSNNFFAVSGEKKELFRRYWNKYHAKLSKSFFEKLGPYSLQIFPTVRA